MNNDNHVIVGGIHPPVTTSFDELLALPASDRIVVIEDCPELQIVSPAK